MPTGNPDLFSLGNTAKVRYNYDCNDLKRIFWIDRFLLGHLANASPLEEEIVHYF